MKDEHPVAAHAANELVDDEDEPEEKNSGWAVAGIIILTLLFIYYFGHGNG